MHLHRPRSSLEHHLVHEYLTFDDGINHNCLVVCAIIQAQTWQVGAQALAMDKQNEMVAQKNLTTAVFSLLGSHHATKGVVCEF